MDIGNPTIKQLRYLQAVIKHQSFRQAAIHLGVSQPTITAQIASLEETLGITLLERSKSGTLPTAVARSIMEPASQILEQVNSIRDIARYSIDEGLGIHRLGVPPTLGPYLMPDVISDIHKSYPSLRLFVREDTPRNLEHRLLSGDFDVILTTLPLDVEGLITYPLFGEPFELCAAPDHPLTEKKIVSPADIKDEYLITIEERHRLYEQMQSLARTYDARILRDYEGTSLDTVRQMIATGIGLGFLPSLYVRSEILPRDDVQVLKLSNPPFDREVVLACRPSSQQKNLYRDIGNLIKKICRERLTNHVHMTTL